MLKIGGLYEIPFNTWYSKKLYLLPLQEKEEDQALLPAGSMVVVLEKQNNNICDSSYYNTKILLTDGSVGWICEHRLMYQGWKLLRHRRSS